jgi:hypothetical protein
MTTNTTKNVPKMFQSFFCEKCDYGCSKKSIFDKHLLTKKHNTTKSYKILQDGFTCECGKEYKHRTSLYHHKRYCEKVAKNVPKSCSEQDEPEVDMKELVLKVLSENKELVSTICDQQKTIQSMVPKLGNNNNNNNNNKININLYLNEHCKNAITLDDMTESIKITLGDLCNASDCGLLANVQNLLIHRLNETDENMRPIHCTDTKRKTLYVKDHEGWGKDENHNKIKASISKLADNHMACFANEYDNDNELVGDDDKFVNIMGAVSKEVEEDEKGMNKTINNIANAAKLTMP